MGFRFILTAVKIRRLHGSGLWQLTKLDDGDFAEHLASSAGTIVVSRLLIARKLAVTAVPCR